MTKNDPVKKAYESLWEEKLNDSLWLKNDGKGRVEYCAKFLEATDRVKDSTKILDIGCGRGTLGHYLTGRKYIYGIDISENAISEAKKILKRADCINLDQQDLPHDSAFFDIIISLDVIEHLFDPIHFLKETFRVLKPGGELILSTPNILHEELIKSLVHTRRFPKTSGDSYPYDGGHIHFFTYQDIYDLLMKAGMSYEPIGPYKETFDYEFKESMVWVLGKKHRGFNE